VAQFGEGGPQSSLKMRDIITVVRAWKVSDELDASPRTNTLQDVLDQAQYLMRRDIVNSISISVAAL
jgi:hypothetical protein